MRIKCDIDNYFLFINLAVLAFQIVYTYNIFFFTGWDAGRIFDAVHHVINQGGFRRINAIYPFSLYPNNLGIFSLLLAIEWLARQIHVDGYLASVMLSVLSINISGVFLFYSLKSITGKPVVAWMTWGLYLILFGFSPWITLPYTDTISMFFPITAVFLYCTKNPHEKNNLRTILIGFLLFAGLYIKPTVAITLIAIILVELLAWAKNSEKVTYVRRLVPIGLIVLGGIPAILGNVLIQQSLSGYLKSEARFNALHYLNMGLNNESDGIYSSDDIDYSISFPTVRERNIGNLVSIKERLANFGLVGYVEFLSRKALVIFADGTFAWGIEGNFFRVIPVRTHPLNQYLNSYILRDGENYSKFITNSQFPWYLCLMLLPFLGLSHEQNVTHTTVICLSILGITAFLMLFEARARYLINCIPVIVVGVGLGYDNLITFVDNLIKNRKAIIPERPR